MDNNVERQVCCMWTAGKLQIFVDSLPHGPQITLSDVTWVNNYKWGVLHGLQQAYQRGNLMLQYRYHDGDGPWNIVQWISCRYMNANGVIERLERIGGLCNIDYSYPITKGYNLMINVDRLLSGTMELRLARGGPIVATCPVQNGYLNGTMRWYRRNQLRATGTVIGNKCRGPWFFWTDAGELQKYKLYQ